MNTDSIWRWRRITVIAIILLVLVLNVVDGLDLIHRLIYDTLYETANPVSKDIVIVGISDSTYEKLGRWPFSRETQASIFDEILKQDPAVLGIDILYDSKVSDLEDQALVSVLGDESVVLASAFSDGLHSTEEVYIKAFDDLDAVTDNGYINPEVDPIDGVVRQVYLNKNKADGTYQSFALQVYDKFNENMSASDTMKDYGDSTEALYIDFAAKRGSTDVIPAEQLISDTGLPEGLLEDRIVLFGPYTIGMQDSYITPMDRQDKTFGVEIHANIIQNMMEDSFKVDTPIIFELLMIVIFMSAGYFTIGKLQLKAAIGMQVFLLILISIIGRIVFSLGFVTETIYPITGLVLIFVSSMIFKYVEQLGEKRWIRSVFGRYVAPQVVDRLLEEGSDQLALGGKRQEISILFVDIRGFTPLSEVTEPEEIVEILNDYLDLCSKAVFENEGTLDKFIGDAAMAVFNAPMPLEDHAYYAVKAAWMMKDRGNELAQKMKETFGKEVQFGIGVNTGKAIVGNIGSSVRMDYTAIGDTVNTAARLESIAGPGEILISKETYDLVKERVEARCLGPKSVKGKKQMIDVYSVIGI